MPKQKLCSSLLLILGFIVVLPHLDTWDQSLWDLKGCIPTKSKPLSSGLHLGPNGLFSNKTKVWSRFLCQSLCSFWSISFFDGLHSANTFRPRSSLPLSALFTYKDNSLRTGLFWHLLFFSFFPQQNSVTFKALISQLWYDPKCFSKNCLNTSFAHISSNDGKFCLAVGRRL